MKTLRLLSLASLAALAAASQAVVFSFAGLTSSGASTSGTFASQLLTVDGSGSPFNTITGASVTLSSTVGSATFASPLGSLLLTFASSPTGTQTPGFASFSTTATISPTSTGSFASFGGGQVSITSNTSSVGTNLLTVLGNPTPEPSALAALSLGAAGLLRRRKRA